MTTYLALDTSTPTGSVALSRDSNLVSRALLTRQAGHASALLPAVDQVLDAAGVRPREIDALVVGEGPGSFTGVRVAAATAKGLTAAMGFPLFAVSSLAGEALAHEVHPIRYALFDARAERVYGACYGVGSARFETLVEPHAAELRDLLADDVPPGSVFVGDGSEKHRAVIEAAGFEVAATPEGGTSLADGLLKFMALVEDWEPLQDPGSWEPAYVRVSGAERLWRS